jgi:hypothetical protein
MFGGYFSRFFARAKTPPRRALASNVEPRACDHMCCVRDADGATPCATPTMSMTPRVTARTGSISNQKK